MADGFTNPRRFFVVSAVAIACLIVAVVEALSATISSQAVLFNRDIRPILSDNCFACHGPDASHRQADLRLDVLSDALAAVAIVPGNVSASRMIARITTTDSDEIMPPAESHKKLDNRQKALLVRWIEQGAQYQRHWAYEKPVQADVPLGTNGIDHLVAKRLAEVGLKPATEADRRTLIRRLSFDLLGLPPTPEAVAAFEHDTAADAYEQLVDRLLASPHYGEKMAMGWLDVVRFADTIGYHSDNSRNVWPYRDWVITSFNNNKPFDRFTIEQVAGDLLPDANQDTRIGSAFNRLLLSTEEGGAQPKDYEARMLTDRVRAIGAAWLGQTTGCAQCHDHKFDPFTTRDFYALGAFFADIKEPIIGRLEEGMLVGTLEERKQLDERDAALAEARKKLDAILPQLDVAQQQWEADIVAYAGTLPELLADSKATEAEKKGAKQVVAFLKKEVAKRNCDEKKVIQDYFRNKGTHLFESERKAFALAESDRNTLCDVMGKCVVSVRSDRPRTVRILPRGNWMDETGEVMKPAIPHYLQLPTYGAIQPGKPVEPGEPVQPETADRELSRLDLAEWLVSPDHPLTARVVMNRLWKQFFGMGLSRVLDDLGAQGEQPVNPQLLDWLACEFIKSQWDVKHMVRTIVTSATYKQTSKASTELIAADPSNREFARQSAFRVDAEHVRDTALSVSGLLVRTLGGPSVKPYQPEGYWENLNFPGRTYPVDGGEKQYRRGMYTWWQRSFLHPSMLAFDAPNREECCAEPTRSNIPQQALALLNDPSYVEAARVFATKILTECPGSPEDRMAWGWQQTLQRLPRAEELEAMMPCMRENVAHYKSHPSAADALVAIGLAPVPTSIDKQELAAWTHVARVLLNLHETITRP